MAITLSINLTDVEQAKLLEIASIINPDLTPTQVKNWAEKQAKEGLREAVQRKLNQHNQASLESVWPGFKEPPIPPETPPTP